MTTHEMARQLLALPDIRLTIEGWCRLNNHQMTAEITGYDENTAIIWQKPDPRLPERTTHDCGAFRWINIPTQLPTP